MARPPRLTCAFHNRQFADVTGVLACARAVVSVGVYQLHRSQQSVDCGTLAERRTWHFGFAARCSAVSVFLHVFLLSAPVWMAGRSLRREVGVRDRLLSLVE